jgi:colicin import membrane protein
LSAAAFSFSSRERFQAEPGTGKAFSWAMGMHLLLIIFLTVGLNWKSQTPAGLEAEIWDNVPVVKSVSQAVEQKMDADEKADIAMKKKKELEKKQEPKKEELKATKKVDPKELKKQKAEEEKQAQLKEAKLKEDKKKAQEKAKTESERKEAMAQDKARADQLARLRSAAGKEGASGGRGGVVGDGVGGGGNAKPGYADKVRRKILPLIIFNPSLVAGNPATEVGVELAPDGTIISRKVLKSSGDAGWDRAVLRAIDEAQTLPKDDDGKVPKQIRLTFKPKD